MERDTICYALQLEMLERHSSLDDRQAIDLLRAEFALAHNAGRFDAVAVGDVELGSIARSTPQEGVARYSLALHLAEREDGLDDARAVALLRQAFTNALNASYFLRVCVDDDVRVELVSRSIVSAPMQLRRAA